VTIHERDPNWQKARELTTGAEHQSKLSAAKAYEAEAFLVGASESHEQAQAALSAKTNLLAQAEAEKRNIGQADYIHKEYDHAKKVQEDLEKHRIEINKGVDQTKGLVAAKEKELQAVLPQAQQQASQIDALTGKLGSLQQAKAGLENKEAANAQRLRELEGQKGQFAGQIESLEADVLRLNKHADDLERQAHAARQEANTAGARLKELRGSLSTIARDQDAAARSLQAVNKDLEAYKMKEAELAEKLNAAQLAAKRSADAAAAKEAELQLARQQFEAERAKGQPIEKEIEKYRLQIQEKERQYTEAQESSKTAKAAYEKFLGEANAADAAYKKALSEKERKVATYSQTKQEAELANARATDMWNQAKKFGNTGDANALQRLAEAEKTLQQEEGLVSRELVAPNVGVKQPTSEGPKFTRTEDSRERNEDTQKETVRTKALA
jgi:chromosome segregation ATPase